MRNILDCNLKNKKVFIRVDFNVPIDNGVVTNDKRIQAALPTIKHALEQNAAVFLISHLGRPPEGRYDAAFSLAPLIPVLTQLLHQEVQLVKEWDKGIELEFGRVALGENCRFISGESRNDPLVAKKIASWCDVFVMDAFASAHRAHVTTVGLAEYAPMACAGLCVQAEIDALSKALKNPAKPLVTVVGGAKVSTKITLLQSLLQISDYLIVGGGIANTLLAAAGYPIGASLYEADHMALGKTLLATGKIPLPHDVIVADDIQAKAAGCKFVTQVAPHDKIFDIGPQTRNEYVELLQQAKTIIWNGPVGVFENPLFAEGTTVVGRAIADSSAFSLAGGGDTIAAIDQLGIADNLSYISTGGGAFLEFIEGKSLPGLLGIGYKMK